MKKKVKTIKYRELIESKIKKARFKEALDDLEKYIKIINDKELNIQVLTLYARFNTEYKKTINGLTKDTEEHNKIIFALTHLLDEAEEIAKEKINKIEESQYFNRDYRNMLLEEFKKFLDEREFKLLDQEINYDSLKEFLFSRFPGIPLVISFGFIETFPHMLIEYGYKNIRDLQSLLNRTEEARIQFNKHERFGQSAARELFIALGLDVPESLTEFNLYEDKILIDQFRHLVK